MDRLRRGGCRLSLCRRRGCGLGKKDLGPGGVDANLRHQLGVGFRLAVGSSVAPAAAPDHDPTSTGGRAGSALAEPTFGDGFNECAKTNRRWASGRALAQAVAVESAGAGTGNENAGTTSVGRRRGEQALQDLGVAAAPLAEVEVVADADRIGLQGCRAAAPGHELRRSLRGKSGDQGCSIRTSTPQAERSSPLRRREVMSGAPRPARRPAPGAARTTARRRAAGPGQLIGLGLPAVGPRPTEQLLMAQDGRHRSCR